MLYIYIYIYMYITYMQYIGYSILYKIHVNRLGVCLCV